MIGWCDASTSTVFFQNAESSIPSTTKTQNSACQLDRDKWIFRRTTRLLIFVVLRRTWSRQPAPSLFKILGSDFNGSSLLQSRRHELFCMNSSKLKQLSQLPGWVRVVVYFQITNLVQVLIQ